MVSFDIKFKCKKCGEILTPYYSEKDNQKLSEEKQALLVLRERTQLEGKDYFLTYYTCPLCGDKNILQIDDVLTVKAVEKLVSMMLATRTATDTEKKKLAIKAKNINSYVDKRHHNLMHLSTKF